MTMVIILIGSFPGPVLYGVFCFVFCNFFLKQFPVLSSLKQFLNRYSFLVLQDINGICSTGTRICRCMCDYFIFLKRYTEIRNALLLSKCLKQRLWENTKFQIKQIVGVGLVTAKVIKIDFVLNEIEFRWYLPG